mmetsp:Transcript_43583/g.131892  ORF Transcript_43583/g.131892 Transcript_43583/m.131892 type:complete len:240 (+) Transcript_43583:107-826(+)
MRLREPSSPRASRAAPAGGGWSAAAAARRACPWTRPGAAPSPPGAGARRRCGPSARGDDARAGPARARAARTASPCVCPTPPAAAAGGPGPPPRGRAAWPGNRPAPAPRCQSGTPCRSQRRCTFQLRHGLPLAAPWPGSAARSRAASSGRRLPADAPAAPGAPRSARRARRAGLPWSRGAPRTRESPGAASPRKSCGTRPPARPAPAACATRRSARRPAPPARRGAGVRRRRRSPAAPW